MTQISNIRNWAELALIELTAAISNDPERSMESIYNELAEDTELKINTAEIKMRYLAANGCRIWINLTNNSDPNQAIKTMQFAEIAAYIRENRLEVITYLSWMEAVKNKFANLNSDPDTYGHALISEAWSEMAVHLFGSEQTKQALEVILETKPGYEEISSALREYEILLKSYTEREIVKDSGLAAKIREQRQLEHDTEAIESQIQEYQTQVSNMLVARTWGWEVEAPNPGDEYTVPAGVEAGSDGSVVSYEAEANYEDCECGCRDCNYHECDCDDCDQYNDDPEHCGDYECARSGEVSVEFRTTGGIPRAQHPGLRKLLEQIHETEKNETAGTHIHVYAKDLSPEEIAVVLGAYAINSRIWDVIAGRDHEKDEKCRQYANQIPVERISGTLRYNKLYHVGKFTAINTHHVTSDRGTLEFRQMNCNFDYNRITFMAWMARGLVEVAKRGAKVHEFFAVKDIKALIELYAKYEYTLTSETTQVDDPMGSRYNQSRNRIEVA